MHKLRTWGWAIAGGALLLSGPALAGSAVTGTGNSPSAAMDDANNRASQISQSRWGRSSCYSPAVFERCSQQSGYWVCTAYVNNEAGSSC